MSTKKASAPYKPGQSAKKAAASASAARSGTGASSSSSGSSSSARKLSLAQQIAELSNPTPKDFDPEDVENGGIASARVTEDYDNFDDDDSAPKLLSERSTIRKNFDIEDVSEEYKGRVVSRKSLQAFSDDEEEDDDEGEEDAEDDEEVGEDVEMDDDEQMDGEDEEAEDDEDDADEYDEDGEDEDEEGSDLEGTGAMLAAGLSDQQRKVQQQLAALEEEDEQATSLFQPRGAAAVSSSVTSSSAASQYTKSVHMKNQLSWYTHLLNMRIRVQGVLAHANRLPSSSDTESGDVREEFVAHSDEVAPAYLAALGDARKLLEDLFDLQTGLMRQNEKIFTASVPHFAGTKRKHADDENEEEEQEEDAATEAVNEEGTEEVLDAYWQHLSATVQPFFRPIQDALINKWNTKTQLSAGQLGALGGGANGRGALTLPEASLKVINQSVVAQIDSIMLDEGRLVRRSQLNRAAADRQQGLLGRVSGERERALKKPRRGQQEDPDLLLAAPAEEHDAAIYDDNDFYQQVLSEIISQAGGETGGDSELVNKAAAARKKTRKSGAQVDRRASKGRKLRYTVHAKLTNFMAPRAAPISTDFEGAAATDANRLSGTDFAMDELFLNLFGGGLKA